ncbi:MAG: hypothetical protein Q9220_002993 [cf. Caloplaca sp. 1 TL-2023]
MAPQVLEAAAGSAAKEFKKESTAARLLGSGSAGIAELAIFHPVDTIAKRLMSNHGKVSSSGKIRFDTATKNQGQQITSNSMLNNVIFKDKADAAITRKLTSLFPGLGYAAGYKVLQRIYKYGGQPFVRDYLALHHGDKFDRTFGKGTGKAMMSATAGSIIGVGEIVLLPLDVLKIKRQTNPEAFRGRGVARIVADEGLGLYRGAGWTAARNAPGSFALFGGSAFAKEYLYKLTDYNTATWAQNFVASIAGASASLIVSAPLDVIKTRIQNRNFDNPESGFKIVGNMVRNEGFSSFFKGLTPKLLMTGPKLVFSFWLAQTLIPAFNKELNSQDEHQQRRERDLIHRSTIVSHPLAVSVNFEREIGASGPHVETVTTAWVKGIEKHDFIHPKRPATGAYPERIQHFIHDHGTGAVVFWLNPTSGFITGNTPMATSLGTDGTKPSIYLTRLLDPSEIVENRHRARRWRPTASNTPNFQSIIAVNEEVTHVIQPREVDTIWASAAEPSSFKGPIFAVGTSKGVMVAGLYPNAAITSTKTCDWIPDDNHSCVSDTTSVDFWTPDTILAGLRNGKIRIWDTRSNGTNTRFLHHPASCINHVRALDENKILVAGLSHSLSVYDARFTKPHPQSSSDPFPTSQPVFSFPTYRNKDHAYPRLGLDVYRNSVAAGTDDGRVQIFDVRSGKELSTGAASIVGERRARCVKFVDDDKKGLQLLVANGENIDRWGWS